MINPVDGRTVGRLDWHLPAAAAVGSSFLFLISLALSADGAIFFYWPAVFFLSLALLVGVVSSQKRRLSFLLALLVFAATSFAMSKVPFEERYQTRNAIRWFLWSKSFKAEVLSQPDHSDKGWKHLECDGWGFAGAGDTSVYLVYNPSNLLEEASKTQFGGAVLTPTPRGVVHVQRLEKDWYSVVFPTDADWERE